MRRNSPDGALRASRDREDRPVASRLGALLHLARRVKGGSEEEGPEAA